MDDAEKMVRAALIHWGPDADLDVEIPHANRASRTWHGRVQGRHVVVKLTFDGPGYVEPGFRVAAYVQDITGVPTGYPLVTQDGCWTVPLHVTGRWPWTLAVMEFVEGVAVGEFDDAAAAKTGQVLGLVHGATSRPAVPTVPANTLDFFETHPPLRSDPRVQRALAGVAAVQRDRPLTYGVVYGDPRPELLWQADQQPLALIDWGTPSRGPLMLDVATWHGHVTRHASSASAAATFLDAYEAVGVLPAWELELLDTFRAFWEALTQPAAG